MEIGAQLFTVRDFCKNTDDFAETLKKVAEIGYKNVQVSGVCEFEPEWLAQQLKKNGLKCVLTHVNRDWLVTNLPQDIADHGVYGCKMIGLGIFGFNEDLPGATYETFFNRYKPVTKAIKDSGNYFMYHNHDAEFARINGKTYLERIIEDFAPDELGITFDVFWAQMAGVDPAQCMEMLAGRIPCIHLKDFAYSSEQTKNAHMAEVGEGNINFARIFEKAEAGGTEYMLVEQDDCHGKDPFKCLKTSYDNLRSWGFR